MRYARNSRRNAGYSRRSVGNSRRNDRRMRSLDRRFKRHGKKKHHRLFVLLIVVLFLGTGLFFFVDRINTSELQSRFDGTFDKLFGYVSEFGSKTKERTLEKISETSGGSYWDTIPSEETTKEETSGDSFWDTRDTTRNVATPVPSETTVSDASGQIDEFAAVEEALDKRESSVQIRSDDEPFRWGDFYSMSYGSFWLQSYSYYTVTEGKTRYIIYEFNYYPDSDSQIEAMKNEMEASIDDIVSLIPDGASAYEKALIVHDALARIVTYDDTLSLPHTHDAYATLVLGYGVCTGYASAYSLIMNRIGVPCQIVDTANHSYNKIGQTYVDVCWDDGTIEENSEGDYISHYYFGMDYDTISAVSDHIILYCTDRSASDDYLIPYYYIEEGYTLSEYDLDKVIEIMRLQQNNGTNMLTVAFDNYEAYEQSQQKLYDDTWTILGALGYEDKCWYNTNDDSMAWSFIVFEENT